MESTIKLYFRQSYPLLVLMGIILCELLFIPRALSDLFGLTQLYGSPLALYWITVPIALIMIALPKNRSDYYTILFFVLFPILAQIIHWIGGFGALLAGGALFGYVRLMMRLSDRCEYEPEFKIILIFLYIIFGLFIFSKLAGIQSSVPDLILVLVYGVYVMSNPLKYLLWGYVGDDRKISGFPMLLPLLFSGLLLVLLLIGSFPGTSALNQIAALKSAQSETVVEQVENQTTIPETTANEKQPIETPIAEADQTKADPQSDQKAQTQPTVDNTPKEPIAYNVNASWTHEGKYLIVNKVTISDDVTEVEFTYINRSEYNARCAMFLREGSEGSGYYIKANGKKLARDGIY